MGVKFINGVVFSVLTAGRDTTPPVLRQVDVVFEPGRRVARPTRIGADALPLGQPRIDC